MFLLGSLICVKRQFMAILDIPGLSDFEDRTNIHDDEVTFTFTLRLMDHVTLSNNHKFDFMASVRYGSSNQTVINGTGDTTLTVYSPSTDTASITWSTYFTQDPVNVVQE